MTETEPKPSKRSESLGCLAILLLWVVLGLHFFSDWFWDKEPPVLKWIVVGYGCLVLLGLLGSLVFGKRGEKITALIFLGVIALAVVFIPSRQDRKAAAAVDELVSELSTKGAEFERQADALPVIADQPAPGELPAHLGRVIEELQLQAQTTKELLGRAAELLPRAPEDKRGQLLQAVRDFNQQVGRAGEKREQWMQKVREKVAARKKQPAEPK